MDNEPPFDEAIVALLGELKKSPPETQLSLAQAVQLVAHAKLEWSQAEHIYGDDD